MPIWKEQHLTSGGVTWVGLPDDPGVRRALARDPADLDRPDRRALLFVALAVPLAILPVPFVAWSPVAPPTCSARSTAIR